MDVMTGLSAASQAIGLVKQLRDFDKAIDDGVFKAKLLELQEAVFEARSALLDAKEIILERDEQILLLKRDLKAATSGETCPFCKKGEMELISERPDPKFGFGGLKERSYKCTNLECGKQRVVQFNPNSGHTT